VTATLALETLAARDTSGESRCGESKFVAIGSLPFLVSWEPPWDVFGLATFAERYGIAWKPWRATELVGAPLARLAIMQSAMRLVSKGSPLRGALKTLAPATA
jgi:hypothetical protein